MQLPTLISVMSNAMTMVAFWRILKLPMQKRQQ